MSVLDSSLTSARYEELAGARVVITGVSARHGVDVARAFADCRSRLVLHTSANASDPELTALLALLSETASEIKLFDERLITVADAQRFAQTGVQSFGGVDCIVNLMALTSADLDTIAQADDIEAAIEARLELALQISRVGGNRMRMMLTEGSILNVVMLTGTVSGQAALVAGLVRTLLAEVTRKEAEAWAPAGIRVNAIAPRVTLPGEKGSSPLASEPEVAAVALYLASARSKGLSGHVFQAEGALTTCA